MPGKFYDRFSAHERFRLVVEAKARGDEEEAERLADSCPRYTYKMNDAAYGDRMRASLEITIIVCLDLATHLAKLRMIDAFRVILPYSRTVWTNEAHLAYLNGHLAGSRYAWRQAGMEGDPPGWEAWDEEDEEGEERDEESFDPGVEGDLEKVDARIEGAAAFTPELLDRLELELAGDTLTIWEAFSGFCEEELGLEPEKLLKAYFEPILEEVGKLKGLAENPDAPSPDPEGLAVYREAMRGTWSVLVREA